MKSCQATFCTPIKICQKWARFIKKVKLCKFIEYTLKINYNGRNFNNIEKGNNLLPMESVLRTSMTVRFLVELYPNVGFTKLKVQKVVNLFENMLKYPNHVLVLYERIKAFSIINYVQMLFLTL
jgi:hypothetical protein